MEYLYGKLSNYQVKKTFKNLHGDIHKLLIYKDENFEIKPFEKDDDYEKFFTKLLYKFGSLNVMFKYPPSMIKLITILQAAFIESKKKDFNYEIYRSMILDSHSYLDSVKEEVM